jgi:hypothetical protein
LAESFDIGFCGCFPFPALPSPLPGVACVPAAVKKAKAVSDDKIERSLFERATGYSVPDVHVSTVNGQIVKTSVIKHYPPDVTAMILWLKNRRPDVWRDKREAAVEGLPDIQVILNSDGPETVSSPPAAADANGCDLL